MKVESMNLKNLFFHLKVWSQYHCQSYLILIPSLTQPAILTINIECFCRLQTSSFIEIKRASTGKINLTLCYLLIILYWEYHTVSSSSCMLYFSLICRWSVHTKRCPIQWVNWPYSTVCILILFWRIMGPQGNMVQK